MTIKEIKENGKLREIENPPFIPIYREYWEYKDRVYLIDENDEIEESYEID